MHPWHVRRAPWLQSLKPALVDELRRAAIVRSFARGERIFEPTPEPQSVWLVEVGLVRIQRLAPDGRRVTLSLVRPGDVFGEVSVLSDSPRLSLAEAVRRSTCWKIPREVFVRVVRSDPDAGFAISKELAGRIARIETRLEDLVFRNVDARVIRTLLCLAEEFGRPAGGGWLELEIDLTQSELATLIGTTRQSVNECLRDLTARELVGRRRVRLALDASRLAELRALAGA